MKFWLAIILLGGITVACYPQDFERLLDLNPVAAMEDDDFSFVDPKSQEVMNAMEENSPWPFVLVGVEDVSSGSSSTSSPKESNTRNSDFTSRIGYWKWALFYRPMFNSFRQY